LFVDNTLYIKVNLQKPYLHQRTNLLTKITLHSSTEQNYDTQERISAKPQSQRLPKHTKRTRP